MVIFLNGSTYIGSTENFLEWAIQNFRYIDNTSGMIYKKMANDAYRNVINNTPGRSYVYIDISYGDVSTPERVLIELFEDVCPVTTKNFKELCKGFVRADKKTVGYANSYIDRIVKGQYIQGGNIGSVLDSGKGKSN